MPNCSICGNSFSIGFLNSLTNKDKKICDPCLAILVKDVQGLNTGISQLFLTIEKIFGLWEFSQENNSFFLEKYNELTTDYSAVSQKRKLLGIDDACEYINDEGYKILGPLVDLYIRYSLLSIDNVVIGAPEYEMDADEICVFSYNCYLREIRKFERGGYGSKITDGGIIYLTNRRVLFIGRHKTLQYPLKKIKNIKQSSGIQLITGDEVKPKSFSFFGDDDFSFYGVEVQEETLLKIKDNPNEITARIITEIITNLKKDTAFYKDIVYKEIGDTELSQVSKVDLFVDDSSDSEDLINEDETESDQFAENSNGIKIGDLTDDQSQNAAQNAITNASAAITLNTKQPEIRRLVDSIVDGTVKLTMIQILNDLLDLGAQLSSYKEGKQLWIECKYDNDEIGYFLPMNDSVKCQYFSDENDDWIEPPVIIHNLEEWQSKCKANVYRYIK